MMRLIKLQLRNVFHNKLFYICLGLFLALSIAVPYFSATALKVNVPLKVLPQIGDFLSSELGIVTSIFVAIFCCLDFNEGTTKNIIARGYTRMQLLISKYLVSAISVFIMYGIAIVVMFILYSHNGIGYDSNMPLLFINYLFKIMASIIFYGTISFLLEKNSSAIIASIFIPTLIPAIIGFLDSNFKLKMSQYLLSNVTDILTKNPTIINLLYTIVIYLIYIFVFILIAKLILKKKEIK